MRRIIKFFKKSAIRTEILNKEVASKEGKVLKLLLDCKTRWNTLATSVSRFLKLYPYVNSALHKIGVEPVSGRTFVTLTELSNVLEPIKLAVEELSKEDANLLSAEGTLFYVFQQLQKLDSPLSEEMFRAISKEIEKRRVIEVVSLLLFLHHGSYPKSNAYFTYSSKTSIKQFAKSITTRLFAEIDEDMQTVVSISDDEDAEPTTTPFDELKHCLSTFTIPKAFAGCSPTKLNIEKEFRIIEQKGRKTERMTHLHQAMLTIRPTSTACERVFSVAGNFITKLRSRLDTSTLNALVFLKYYFVNKK